MDFVTQIVPALIVILANLAGGSHESPKYEIWTAIFGWMASVSLILVFLSGWFWPEAQPYLLQVSGFSLLTALTRDYEKILRPFFNKKR